MPGGKLRGEKEEVRFGVMGHQKVTVDLHGTRKRKHTGEK